MQKYISKKNDPNKLLIKSAIALDHLKGFIYIEADKESHVVNAIKGLRNLQQWGFKLVPIKEMPEVVSIPKRKKTLKKGDWCRVKRGLYKGDIAQILEIDDTKGKITIKLIPRLNFGMIQTIVNIIIDIFLYFFIL